MKINDIFKEERYICGSTGTDYYVCRIEGGVILLDVTVEPPTGFFCGGKQKKTFTFQCVREGDAAIQFAYIQSSVAPYTYIYEDVLPFTIEASCEDCACGGWTDPHPLTEEDWTVFNKAMEGLCGVGYQPTAVATQVVNGTNYRFSCDATLVYKEPVHYKADVYIFQPIGKDPYLTQIVPIPEN